MPYKSVSITNTTPFVVATPDYSADRVRLCGGFLSSNATVTVQFQTSTGNTAVSGAFTLIAGVPLVLPTSTYSPGGGRRPGYLQSNTNDALQITLGAANCNVAGALEYILVAE